MKKLLGILILGISIIFLYSCAKPTVVSVVLPGDDELNCEQLENAVAESQKIKREKKKEKMKKLLGILVLGLWLYRSLGQA